MIIFNHSPFIDFLLKKCYNIYRKGKGIDINAFYFAVYYN